jgi:hypothetical protein
MAEDSLNPLLQEIIDNDEKFQEACATIYA